MVPLRHLKLLTLYDEQRPCGRIAVRVAVYRPLRDPHGVVWSSAAAACAYKDLSLRPALGGRGLRMDLNRPDELRLALDLDRRLTMAAATGRCSRRLHWPRLWAGFALGTPLTAHGPEFEQLCERFDLPAATMQKKFLRTQRGLTLLPLDWVSDQLAQASDVLVELPQLPQRRVFRYDDPSCLTGFQGASRYDLHANRFRARYEAAELRRLVAAA
ncbi:MAG: hypothetical protein CMJ58_07900 [Planctomycetaceae bacterium]|nr:hypothetical protein [Planctomycetaceae bacterium]